MKKLITTDNIGTLVSITLLIYLLVVWLTEVIISSIVIMSAFFIMGILRGLEAYQEGKKVSSGVIFAISLIIIIVIVLSLF
ncbi:MAG: hypothetical protein ACQEUT_02655 [Bacillota bacterium]